jgi:hypothetical protein
MAIGIALVGFLVYFQRLFAELGIAMSSNMLHYLRNQFRILRLAKLKTLNKKKHAQLVEDTKIARRERYQWAETYRRGMNLDDDEEDRPRKSKPVCPRPFCGLTGHVTTKSKKCKANPGKLREQGLKAACAVAVATAQASNLTLTAVTSRNANADEMDDLDAIQK